MSQPSLPPQPTPRESWRIEGRLYREQETPPEPGALQEALVAVLALLRSPDLLTDPTVRQRVGDQVARILERM